MSSSRASSGERALISALALITLAACTTRGTKASTPTEVTVFFSAEVRGYLGPCGCSENMRGSISRAAFQVAQARASGRAVHLVDCGDGLFGEANIPEPAVPQQERKAKALSESWKAMGLDARVPGPLDDARGADFHASLQLPELSKGSVKVLDGVAVLHASSVKEALTLVPRAKELGGRFVVAVIPLPFGELLREALDAKGIHLLLSSRSKDAFAAEESRLVGGATRVAQIQSKGRSLLKVDVSFHGDGGVEWMAGDAERDRELATLDQRIELLRAQVNEPMLGDDLKALRKAKLEEIISRREALAAAPVTTPTDRSVATARLVPLESTFPKDEKVQAIEKAYDVDVGLLNLAYAKEKGVSCVAATQEKPGIVGSKVCVSCHAEAERVWLTTKHPLAYKALEAQGKQLHLDCVGCHVTGWQQPDGVCRIDQLEGRTEVGCESCHGPGSNHAKAPAKTNIARGVDPKTCVGCHDRENSPQFDYDTYVEKVLGPGHDR